MKINQVNLKPITVKIDGEVISIDISKELTINENIINSQLKESPSSYYLLCRVRDKYIKRRDALAREKDEAYSKAWTYLKDCNERWNNDYVSHKANVNNKYCSLYQRYLRAVDKANLFISICKAYEDRSNILRTLNANLRKTL
jgi:hypothetical protein